MTKRDIRCIIYDVGGTLLQPAPLEAALRQVERQSGGLGAPIDKIIAALPNVSWHLRRHDEPMGTLWASPARLARAWQELYAEALQQAGCVRPWEELLEVGSQIDEVYSHPHHWQIFDDAVAALQEGARRGLRQGIISDWEDSLPNLLNGLGLIHHFDFIVASGAAGFAKPSREIFTLAVQRAGIPAEHCLYVGDSYLQDIIGARSAGMLAVLIDRGGHAPPLDAPVLRSLTDVFDLC